MSEQALSAERLKGLGDEELLGFIDRDDSFYVGWRELRTELLRRLGERERMREALEACRRTADIMLNIKHGTFATEDAFRTITVITEAALTEKGNP